MNIIISNSDDTPLYVQIKEQIKDMILSGILKSGDKLPSIRALAKDLEISVITTKNAYYDLENEGYIKTIPSKGSYVTNKNMKLIKEEQLKKIESLLDKAVTIAKISNIDFKDLESILNILWEDNNE